MGRLSIFSTAGISLPPVAHSVRGKAAGTRIQPTLSRVAVWGVQMGLLDSQHIPDSFLYMVCSGIAFLILTMRIEILEQARITRQEMEITTRKTIC